MSEYLMLPMLPGKPVKAFYLLKLPKNVLMRESAIWVIAKLSHLQQTVVEESAYRTQGMNCTSKMSAMVDKRICTTAAKKMSQLPDIYRL
jgi:hypothetical protein